LRHPFFLLLMGTVISSVIIPNISSRSNRVQLIQTARVNVANEIINRNLEVNRLLNSLQTTLEIFHKDNSGPAARLLDFKSEQKSMRIKMNELYLDFDKHSWFWYGKIYHEAHNLALSESELSRIKEAFSFYERNLVKSTEEISNFWNTCLREEYNPADSTINSVMQNSRKNLDQLSQKREELIHEITRILSINEN